MPECQCMRHVRTMDNPRKVAEGLESLVEEREDGGASEAGRQNRGADVMEENGEHDARSGRGTCERFGRRVED